MTETSYAETIRAIAIRQPSAPAVTCGDDRLDWSRFDAASEALAHRLLELDTSSGDFVTIGLPNSAEFLVAVVACWKVGAVPQPVSSRLPGRELAEIIALAEPRVVIGVEAADGRPTVSRADIDLDPGTVDRLPDAVSPAWKAPTSGGSTGRPKLIVSGTPSLREVDAPSALGHQPGGTLAMPGPLYHNGPFIWTIDQLFQAGDVVLLERFDAEATLRAIQDHHASALYVVPTMMQRIWRLPEEVRTSYDVSSLQVVWHLAAPCPAWLKQAWIDWLGPEVIWELYGGTEGQAATIINGVDWLAHRGSVGKPSTGEIVILDEQRRPLPAGEVGEVFMRPLDPSTPTYYYIGADAVRTEDGWESLGDMGHVDAEGFLYLGDRKADMILSGGANIYPAEVEAAIDRHPAVHSSAVVPRPDDDLGSVLHAVVHAPGGDLSTTDLLAFLADELIRYKIPRTVEFVDAPLRDDAGKVRRKLL